MVQYLIDNVYEVKTGEEMEFVNGESPIDRTGPTDFRKGDVVNVLWDDDELYEAIILDISSKLLYYQK